MFSNKVEQVKGIGKVGGHIWTVCDATISRGKGDFWKVTENQFQQQAIDLNMLQCSVILHFNMYTLLQVGSIIYHYMMVWVDVANSQMLLEYNQ